MNFRVVDFEVLSIEPGIFTIVQLRHVLRLPVVRSILLEWYIMIFLSLFNFGLILEFLLSDTTITHWLINSILIVILVVLTSTNLWLQVTLHIVLIRYITYSAFVINEWGSIISLKISLHLDRCLWLYYVNMWIFFTNVKNIIAFLKQVIRLM